MVCMRGPRVRRRDRASGALGRVVAEGAGVCCLVAHIGCSVLCFLVSRWKAVFVGGGSGVYGWGVLGKCRVCFGAKLKV
jgi:hypothetical protein